MMTGRVTAVCEATLRLTVIGPDHDQLAVESVVDTGFNGFLTLPNDVVRALSLPLVGHRRVTLGDGSTVILELYIATVLWHERARDVVVLQAEGGPLVGMGLLYGSRVVLHVVDDGDVSIEPMP